MPSASLHTEQVLSKYLCSEKVDCYSHFINKDPGSWEGLAPCVKSCGK